ncbi:MAG: hypothetical protein PHU49_16565 [Syntrophorhabdaceae bacterium]|nr:hypothetical protein [Syntrophorhabdaceae bacterium]MDD5245623.1 hypothetical protein [Syntrophorhabdaceae bacterium]
MVKTKRLLFAITALMFLIFGGCFTISGYSQDKPGVIDNPEVKKPQKIQRGPALLRKLMIGLEIIADLTVSPEKYEGPCPGRFTLKGQIYVNKPVTIQYRFVGSSVPPSVSKPLIFEEPGRKEVTYVRELGDAAASPIFDGSAALQVVWPGKAESNVVYFKGICTDQKQSVPQASSSQQTEMKVESAPQNVVVPKPGQQEPLPKEFLQQPGQQETLPKEFLTPQHQEPLPKEFLQQPGQKEPLPKEFTPQPAPQEFRLVQ